MAPRRAPAAILCLLLLGAGCGRQESGGIPTACREGAGAVRQALRSAPGEVRLRGTPLSACLRKASGGGELRDVGTAYLEAAAPLADAAVRDPGGREATQLGYLMGAVHRGASSSQGVASELVRRLEQETARVDTRSAAYRRGERAGSRGG